MKKVIRTIILFVHLITKSNSHFFYNSSDRGTPFTEYNLIDHALESFSANSKGRKFRKEPSYDKKWPKKT